MAAKKGPPRLFRRTLGGFAPDNPEAEAFWRDVAPGELVELTAHRPRNPRHHKLYWAMLRLVLNNQQQPTYRTVEALDAVVKVKLAYGDFLPTSSGVVFVPGTISFAKMDQADFDLFFRDAIRVLIEEVMPGVTPDEVILEVNSATI